MIARSAGDGPELSSGPGFGTFEIRTQDCIDFLRGMPDASVDLIVTDPAYSGMNRHMKFGHGRIVGHYGKPGNERWFHEFSDDPETYAVFLRECHRVLRQDRHIYIMFDSFSMLSLGALVRECFEVKGVVVWDKVHLGMGHYFRRRHEQIVFASKGKRKVSRRDLPDVWAIPRMHRAAYPTQKPAKLFELMVQASAAPGFLVCDPFCGSGSSGVAAVRGGCDFIGADIDPRAVQLSRERLAALVATGLDPLEPLR
ncbi:MAG: site-specific DNA-methyltransferase [Candidatus Dormibacteria bacterium]|jgi:site-specific DNA-methyltransferase (adenine-specific)